MNTYLSTALLSVDGENPQTVHDYIKSRLNGIGLKTVLVAVPPTPWTGQRVELQSNPDGLLSTLTAKLQNFKPNGLESLGYEISQSFMKLDAHIRNGGSLPTSWQMVRTTTETKKQNVTVR